MSLCLGSTVPDFAADATGVPSNHIPSFHAWARSSYTLLFSHPADFTPVCTTELSRAGQLATEFASRNVKLLALSTDSIDSHLLWLRDLKKLGNVDFPIIADTDLKVARLYGMLPVDGEVKSTATVRAVFLIDPQLRLVASILYPMTVGRSFQELLRMVDAVQETAKAPVATPVDWQPGQPLIIRPTIEDAEAANLFPDMKKTDLSYLRYTN